MCNWRIWAKRENLYLIKIPKYHRKVFFNYILGSNGVWVAQFLPHTWHSCWTAPPGQPPCQLDTITWSTIGSIIWTKPPGHSHLISWTQSPGQPPCQLDTVIWSTNWTSTLSPGHLDTTWSTTWSDIHIHLVIRTQLPGQLPCHLVTWTKPLGQLDTTTLPTILSTMAMTMNFDEDQQKENQEPRRST